MSIATPPAPPSTPPVPPNRTQTAPPPSGNGRRKLWWLIVLVIAALGTGALVNWIKQKRSTVSSNPSDEFRRQPHGATNEVASLRQQIAELSARLALATSNSTPTTTPNTNATPTVTGLSGFVTNVSSTVVASNISGVVFTAGGNVNFNNIITNMPTGMVMMSLSPWPAWVKTNPTNSFTAPGPKVEVGKVTTMMAYKVCALEITLKNGYMLYPDTNDLKKVKMVYGDDRGCLTFDPDKHFSLPSNGGGCIRCLIWITPDSTDEAVEFRFMVVPK